MILTARLEAELLKQKWRLPHSFLREIPHREQGILSFANKKRNLFGHFLVDPTLASPIQVHTTRFSSLIQNVILASEISTNINKLVVLR
jgi:hypothetical protein